MSLLPSSVNCIVCFAFFSRFSSLSLSLVFSTCFSYWREKYFHCNFIHSFHFFFVIHTLSRISNRIVCARYVLFTFSRFPPFPFSHIRWLKMLLFSTTLRFFCCRFLLHLLHNTGFTVADMFIMYTCSRLPSLLFPSLRKCKLIIIICAKLLFSRFFFFFAFMLSGFVVCIFAAYKYVFCFSFHEHTSLFLLLLFSPRAIHLYSDIVLPISSRFLLSLFQPSDTSFHHGAVPFFAFNFPPASSHKLNK